MNKKDTAKARSLLAQIVQAGPTGVTYITPDDGALVNQLGTTPFIQMNPAVTDPNDATKIASRCFADGAAYAYAEKLVADPNAAPAQSADPFAAGGAPAQSAAPQGPAPGEVPAEQKAPVAQPEPGAQAASVSSYAIITSTIALPPQAKRGGGSGAPSKYPFDTMEVGQSFFVPNDADKPDAAKSLQSTIATAEMRFATKTGTKPVTRTKRGPGNKAVVNPDGSKVKETVTVDTWAKSREYTARRVKAGVAYGSWTAPADGAVVQRVK